MSKTKVLLPFFSDFSFTSSTYSKLFPLNYLAKAMLDHSHFSSFPLVSFLLILRFECWIKEKKNITYVTFCSGSARILIY